MITTDYSVVIGILCVLYILMLYLFLGDMFLCNWDVQNK